MALIRMIPRITSRMLGGFAVYPLDVQPVRSTSNWQMAFAVTP